MLDTLCEVTIIAITFISEFYSNFYLLKQPYSDNIMYITELMLLRDSMNFWYPLQVLYDFN